MKLYSQADFEQNKQEIKKDVMRMLLCALPFFATAVAGFVLRIQLLCTAGCLLAGGVLIFIFDKKIAPSRRYSKHLAEIHGGLTRQTVGTFVRMGADIVHDIDLEFYEVILNIYEDMDEEGERRFLLDAKKTIDRAWIGRDVVVTHHGSYILEFAPVEEKREQ